MADRAIYSENTHELKPLEAFPLIKNYLFKTLWLAQPSSEAGLQEFHNDMR